MPLQEFLREHNEEAQAAQAAAAAAEAAAAAGDGADGAGGAGGGQSEPLSLWHEMQRRQQADEAAALMESEVSVGGVGLQGPGGVLGEDLWMFDGGLFAEEGERGMPGDRRAERRQGNGLADAGAQAGHTGLVGERMHV